MVPVRHEGERRVRRKFPRFAWDDGVFVAPIAIVRTILISGHERVRERFGVLGALDR